MLLLLLLVVLKRNRSKREEEKKIETFCRKNCCTQKFEDQKLITNHMRFVDDFCEFDIFFTRTKNETKESTPAARGEREDGFEGGEG
jgi:hypothetical protein